MSLTASMILPTHDRPRFVARAVEAILRQTRLPDELIIVNDGTQDVGGEVRDRVVASGVRLLYERRDTPSLPVSKNRGMELATGDVVIFTEDDVILPDDYLAALLELYEADAAGAVDAIGAVVVEPAAAGLSRRLHDALSRLVPIYAWAPRVCAARYVRLPAGLRRRLRPARWISGGALSLRRRVAQVERFEEAFSGYAQAEDTEFAFRVTRRRAMFVAPRLHVVHDRAPSGRPDMHRRGRMYAANMLHIARNSVEGGAGTWMLLTWHFAGLLALYSAWILAGQTREYAAWASGLVGELLDHLPGVSRESLTGPARSEVESPYERGLIRENVRAQDRALREYEQVHGEIFNPVEQDRLREKLGRAVELLSDGGSQPAALDVGCGTGNIPKHLLELGLHVTAADVSARSLERIAHRFADTGRCGTLQINGRDLGGVGDEQFDLVTAYSVLHHVPDYGRLVEEMVRVTRRGGVIYLDHEASAGRYSADPAYGEYLRLAAPDRPKRWTRLLRPSTYLTKLRRMLNPRYEPEGDLHVWADDRIEWDRIESLLVARGCEILLREDYLLYRRGCPEDIYEEYGRTFHDTRLLIARKVPALRRSEEAVR